jgi:hypothetical protein
MDETRAVFSGPAPWLGAFTMPWRAATTTVYQVEISDYSNLTALPSVGVGSRREAQLVNRRYQQETLRLVLNDPAGYLPGGPLAGYVALSNALRVVWTVESAGGGPLTWQSPVYVNDSCPSRDDDALGGNPLTHTAVDWLTHVYRAEYSASGYMSWGRLQSDAAFQIGRGMPPIGGPDTVATYIAAQLWDKGALGLVIDPAWAGVDLRGAPVAPTPPADGGARDIPELPGGHPGLFGDVPVLITNAGQPATWGDLFDYLWNYEPFRITYDSQGRPALRPGLLRRAGPWVVSRDPAVGGLLALPWEQLSRAVRDASFTAVHYQMVANDPTGQDAGAGGGGFPELPGSRRMFSGRGIENRSDAVGLPVGGFPMTVDYGGLAVSASSVNPHRPGVTKTQQITDRQPGTSTAPFGTANAYAAYLLATELGAADTLSITADSAVPFYDLGDEVRIADGAIVNGWYRLTGVSQPLDESVGTLSAEWVADGDG